MACLCRPKVIGYVARSRCPDASLHQTHFPYLVMPPWLYPALIGRHALSSANECIGMVNKPLVCHEDISSKDRLGKYLAFSFSFVTRIDSSVSNTCASASCHTRCPVRPARGSCLSPAVGSIKPAGAYGFSRRKMDAGTSIHLDGILFGSTSTANRAT